MRYKDKFLGYIWSVASPLLYSLVYFIVFSVVMKVDVPNYPLVLMSGLFPWQWFANSISSAPKLFIGNASIIKKVNFPKDIIVLATVLNHLIHYVFSMPVILLFLLIYHELPSMNWIYGIPALLTIQLVMLHGMALVIASLNTFLRDLERLVNILITFVFYFTPVVYPPEMIPKQYKSLMALNPAAPLIISWRELILYNRVDYVNISISFGYALLFLTLGYFVYKKLSWKFAEVI